MTWGEFKRKIEVAGVRDDYVVDYIDVDTEASDQVAYLEIKTSRRKKDDKHMFCVTG